MAKPKHPETVNQSWAVGKDCLDCQSLFQLISSLEQKLERIEEWLVCIAESRQETVTHREFYGVAEFAKLVNKSEYTVREWCRLCRINAEKCESGHGEYKSWKIAADELARYRNHGLLPLLSKY